jgi:hypothetical protein
MAASREATMASWVTRAARAAENYTRIQNRPDEHPFNGNPGIENIAV